MRIVLDENLPKPRKRIFPGHVVTTIQEQGLSGASNGALIARLEGAFDLLVTADKNLRYHQNLAGRRLAIMELPGNRLPLLRPLFPRIFAAVETISPRAYLKIHF
jgi:hypothetical protein